MEAANLRAALRSTLVEVNEQIKEVKTLAIEYGCEPSQVRHPDGSFAMTPLLVAKTQLLCALSESRPTIINSAGRKW